MDEITMKITLDNLPKGPFWEDDGCCWKALECNIDPKDEGWRWHPQNLPAVEKGTPNGAMHPFYPPSFTPNKRMGVR